MTRSFSANIPESFLPSNEDPRFSIARRVARLAWIFMSVFLAAVMAASYLLGNDPSIMGLPAWIAVGNLILPVLFVVLLILVVERFIPDVHLDDSESPGEDA